MARSILMSIVTKRACTSNSREPQKLIMFIDSDYTFSWLDHNIRTCCKQIHIKIQCLFRLDRFIGWLVGSCFQNKTRKKTKVKTVKLVSFKIHLRLHHCYCVCRDKELLTLCSDRNYFVGFFFFKILCEIKLGLLYALWSLFISKIHVILSTGSNMLWGASVLHFFIVAQPSKQFILNSINKFMWQFNINNIIQMKPKDDLRDWNKRSHKLASSLNTLRAKLTSSLIFYFLFLDHKFKMDRIGFNWLWCWNTHLYYPSFPLYSMFNVYTNVFMSIIPWYLLFIL